MAEERVSAGLHGVDDVLAYVDKTVDNVAGFGDALMWTNGEVLEVLADVREGLVSRPDWSEVVESNLRAELTRAKEQAELAALLYDAGLEHVRGERDRARATAVRLEQELVLAETDAACWRAAAGRRAS